MSTSARPDGGQPTYWVNAVGTGCAPGGSGGCSYLQTQAYFHLLDIKINVLTNTLTIQIECGANYSGTATGKQASFDDTPSYVNVYLNGSATPTIMTPPINIPVGYDSYYTLTTSTTITPLTSIRIEGTIYVKASGGSTQANASTSFAFDGKVIGAQITVLSSNPSDGAIMIIPPPINGLFYWIKNMRNTTIYITTSNQTTAIDGFANNVLSLVPGGCIGVISDGTQWWVMSYFGNSLSGLFSIATGASPTAITQPIMWATAGLNKVVELPNPVTFPSRMLATILSAGPSQTTLTVNSNGYLADTIGGANSSGVQFAVGGWGGAGNKGNASIFFISDGTKWYIACLQGNEYIEYSSNSASNKFPDSQIGVIFTNNSLSPSTNYFQLPYFGLSVQDQMSQFIVLKKKIGTVPYTDDTAVTVASTYNIIGSKQNVGNNYSAYVRTQSSSSGDTSYECYFMTAVNVGSNQLVYFFLGYYPWLT